MLGFLKSNSDVVRIATSSRARKYEYAKRLAYYWDEQSDETYNLIARRFSRPEQFRTFTINLVRAIADRRSSTYRLPPRRIFHGADQAVCESLYREMNIDSVLKKSSRYLEVCKTVFLQVGWNPTNEKPVIHVLTPNVLDCEYSDPSNPDRVIVTYAGDRPEDTRFADWTASSFRMLDHRGAPKPVAGNPAGENPYGRLPFVVWHERVPDDNIWLPGGRDLIETQEAVNVALSNLWRSIELHASGQAWASGLSAGEMVEFGPDRVIALPANSQFGFASPNSPIQEILSGIEFVLRQTAATHGVGSDVFDLSKVAESGSAKHAGRLELKEVRQDQIAQARAMEAELFQVIKAVVNAHRPGTIAEGATVAVDFAEQQDQLSEAELIANSQAKLEMGVWSPVDALMAANPDGYSDRQAAFAELQRRRDESRELALQL